MGTQGYRLTKIFQEPAGLLKKKSVAQAKTYGPRIHVKNSNQLRQPRQEIRTLK